MEFVDLRLVLEDESNVVLYSNLSFVTEKFSMLIMSKFQINIIVF